MVEMTVSQISLVAHIMLKKHSARNHYLIDTVQPSKQDKDELSLKETRHDIKQSVLEDLFPLIKLL